MLICHTWSFICYFLFKIEIWKYTNLQTMHSSINMYCFFVLTTYFFMYCHFLYKWKYRHEVFFAVWFCLTCDTWLIRSIVIEILFMLFLGPSGSEMKSIEMNFHHNYKNYCMPWISQESPKLYNTFLPKKKGTSTMPSCSRPIPPQKS